MTTGQSAPWPRSGQFCEFGLPAVLTVATGFCLLLSSVMWLGAASVSLAPFLLLVSVAACRPGRQGPAGVIVYCLSLLGFLALFLFVTGWAAPAFATDNWDADGSLSDVAFHPIGTDSLMDPVSAPPAAELCLFPIPLGDLDLNGLVDENDVDDFALALTNFQAYQEMYPCNDGIRPGDIDGDDDLDLDDIDEFRALVSDGGGGTPTVPEPSTFTIAAVIIAGLAAFRSTRPNAFGARRGLDR